MRVQNRDDDVVAGAELLVLPAPDPEDPIEIVVRDEEGLVLPVPREVLGLVRELLERSRRQEPSTPLRDEEVLALSPRSAASSSWGCRSAPSDRGYGWASSR